MKKTDLTEKINNIRMPADMQERIIINCKIEKGHNNMKKTKTIKFNKKPLNIAASLVLCFCLVGMTTFAAGKLTGYFKDITNINGAVTGTAYEQATDEINVGISDVSEVLVVGVEFVKPDYVPYSELELLGIDSYKIVDTEGNTCIETKTLDAKINNGTAIFKLSADKLDSGEYKLIINSFYGKKKADAPLTIYGNWEVTFTK